MALTRRQAIVGLVVVSAVWGASFTIIKEALGPLSPMALLAVRFLLAAAIALPAFRGLSRRELGPGLLIGLLFWLGFVFQTMGLAHTTPSRSAFVTGLSTPLVPVVMLLVYRRRPALVTVAGVGLAMAGLWLLTRPEPGAAVNRGDLLTLGCAVAFAGQMVAVGHFARRVEPRHLLAVQLLLTGVLSLATAPLLETPRWGASPALALGVLFLAVSAVTTFGFQLRAQQTVSPAQTALVFALEPAFAALTSFLVLGERLGATQWLGGGLIVLAMLLPELPGLRAPRDASVRAAPPA